MMVLHRFCLIFLSLMVTIALWSNSPVWAVSDKNTSDIFNLALDRVRQQNYQQALADFTQVIDRQDNLVGAAYSNRCLVNLQLQNYLAAEADCKTALEYIQDNREIYLNLGLAYYRQAKYPQAIAQYQEIIKRDYAAHTLTARHDYRAYYNRGLAYFALENYQQAISDYNFALTSSHSLNAKSKTLIYNDLALAYMMLEDYQQAIANFDRAIALEDHNYTAYFNRGCAYHRQEKYLAAIKDFTQVVQLKPNFTQAYVNRAILHHQIGQADAAFTDLEIALKQYQTQGDRLAYDQIVNLKQQLFYSQPSQLV